jgi:hypothetical protein
MKSVKQNPAHVFLALITTAFVALVALQIIIIANQGNAEPLAAQTQAPLAALTEEEASEPLIEESVEPTNEPTVTIAPTSTSAPAADIRLGVLDRGFNCPLITEITTLLLEQQLDVKSEIVSYSTPDELFDGLTNNDVDVSLCFIDPLDRAQIKPRLGHIRQIGSYYWEEEDHKLQVWAYTEAKAKLRKDMPCVLNYFEKLSLTDSEWQEQEANKWVQNHTKQIQEWTTCAAK